MAGELPSPPAMPAATTFSRLEARNRSQTRWFVLLVLVVVALAWLVWRQDESNRDLTDLLTRRTPIIRHIEATSDQQVCADKVEVAYEKAVARIVLGAITDNDDAVDDARPELERALRDLERIDELCPPVQAPEET